MNKIRKLREKKGLTLVELIVVIAIIAILTAVLLPLINNWTQQAAYTMLNDGAQTVSNAVNEGISKIIAGGEPLNSSVTSITGTKAASGANQLLITVGGKSSTADGKTAVGGAVSIGTSTEERIAQEIAQMLDVSMTNPSAFTATISNGAVAGVVYSTSQTGAPDVSKTITRIAQFDGYEIEDDDYGAVGVAGMYKVD